MNELGVKHEIEEQVWKKSQAKVRGAKKPLFPTLCHQVKHIALMIPEKIENIFDTYPQPPLYDSFSDWVLEIGPGNGAFLSWLAPQHPHKLFIAIELKRGRYFRIREKIDTIPLGNVQLIHGDARYSLPKILKPECLSEAYILFPDPWPKRRHNKHRLINEERVRLIHSSLKPGGSLWIATDHPDYSSQISSVFDPKMWKLQEGKSLYPTYFETKWKRMGLSIHYFCFVKQKLK